MDMGQFETLLGSYVFPIVACIFLFYLIKDMSEKHADEISTLKETLARNTTALEKLELLISEMRSDIKGKGSTKSDES